MVLFRSDTNKMQLVITSILQSHWLPRYGQRLILENEITNHSIVHDIISWDKQRHHDQL